MSLYSSLLRPDGLLVFTVAGRKHRDGYIHRQRGLTDEAQEAILNGYAEDGFGYADYRDQVNYGMAIVAPARVTQWLEQLPELRLLYYTEAGWHNHLDVIACVRTPDEG
jgi:hypothetical protein